MPAYGLSAGPHTAAAAGVGGGGGAAGASNGAPTMAGHGTEAGKMGAGTAMAMAPMAEASNAADVHAAAMAGYMQGYPGAYGAYGYGSHPGYGSYPATYAGAGYPPQYYPYLHGYPYYVYEPPVRRAAGPKTKRFCCC